jgi:hypothetical protein
MKNNTGAIFVARKRKCSITDVTINALVRTKPSWLYIVHITNLHNIKIGYNMTRALW